MRIGMLTGGGDCPGLNAVIRAVVRKGEGIYGHEIVGFRHGWRGVIDDETMELTVASTRGLIHRGGTILGTSRTNPLKADDGVARALDTLERNHIDALIAIGGDDTLGVAAHLGGLGVSVVGVPKTIDNDLAATDFTFGFQTAVQIASDAIDRLQTTAESHDRVIVVEVMGRHAGWIAIYSGMAGGADIVLVPEEPFDIAEVCRQLEHRHHHGVHFSIVVVAEGAQPKEGTMILQSGERRRVRSRAPRRDQQRDPAGDRESHGIRDTGDGPGPRAPGRDAHCVRPRACDSFRDRRDRRGATR